MWIITKLAGMSLHCFQKMMLKFEKIRDGDSGTLILFTYYSNIMFAIELHIERVSQLNYYTEI